MFKGTAKTPATRSTQAVAAIGGEENAFTASDYTGFFERVPREHLKEMMAFEADRMTDLVLTDAVARPELKVVLEELNMRVANNPGARLDEQMDAALYLNHPYHRPVIGWRHEVEKLNYQDALAFYRRFYTPNNAVVVVAGDVTPDEVKADAEATYGKVAQRAEIGPRVRPTEPVQDAPRTVTLADRASSSRASTLLSGALGHDGQTWRRGSTGRARHCARQGRQQPALQDARHGQGLRAQRRRLLLRHRARLRQVRRVTPRRSPASRCIRSKPASMPCSTM